MLKYFRSVISILLSVIFHVHAAAAEPGGGLDGATGKLFKPDLENRSFELLKETEYDPKTDIRQSRFTVDWTDETQVTKVAEIRSFAGIGGPVTAEFYGIDAANLAAAKDGRPFVARVAVLYSGDAPPAGIDDAERRVIGAFIADPGEQSRSGVVEVDGRPVKVSLRPRHWRIYHHQPLRPADLANGFWQATIHGAEQDGRFAIGRMEVSPLPDPRETDDPKLPRVLAIGDSISMNYHEAAREALKGVANYHRNEGNASSTEHGVRNAELWLGNFHEPGFHWDVIQFNHGLHDLKQTYDSKTDAFGDYSVPIADYQANLEKIIGILRQTGARLIWCATTPVPNDNKSQYARRKGAAREFNQAALEVIERHPDIIVNDLHQVVDGSPLFDDWRKGSDVHFYKPEEQRALGKAVAATVRKALDQPAKKLPLPGSVFEVGGHTAFLIQPQTRKREGPQPWVWYAPTLPKLPANEEKWMFERFLTHGIAVAGIDVDESTGNPAGVAAFSAFHKEMVENRGMSAKPVLLARSRGGLMLYNWAAENPAKVAAIAGIYPVGNLSSWPGLDRAAPAYGMSPDELAAELSRHNPVDRLAPLAKSGVPLFHLHGDNDKTVPLEANSGLIKQRYDQLGGRMTLDVIAGGGHDMKPHWFQSQSLVDFVVRHAKP